MKSIFKKGDKKQLDKKVLKSDVAAFNNQVVHQVCSTFSLAREIEWATRQYVLEMKEEDEEGIGTFISIDHKSPAFVGETLSIRSEVELINNNEIICSYNVIVGKRLIATGKTGQKIMKKEKLMQIFDKIRTTGKNE